MAYTYEGIESSDGDPCECCGTPCPRRRVVVRTESGEYRKLGSTCAALSLRGSSARKLKSEVSIFDRQSKAIRKAAAYLASGMTIDRVRNWLGCWVRCEVRNGALIAHTCYGGKWDEKPVS